MMSKTRNSKISPPQAPCVPVLALVLLFGLALVRHIAATNEGERGADDGDRQTAMRARDDYHSNIDLANIGPVLANYELLDDRQPMMWFDKFWPGNSRVASRFSRSPMSEINGDQLGGQQRGGPSFVAVPKYKRQPLGKHNLDSGILASGRPRLIVADRDLATRANQWASEIIGDFLLDEQKQRLQQQQQQRGFRNPTQPSKQQQQQQQQQQHATLNNGIEPFVDVDGAIPPTRQKRRRCKSDPNLSVKNPSFCDTDAYFGAADYSMRDVWDSAGR